LTENLISIKIFITLFLPLVFTVPDRGDPSTASLVREV